jgi:3-oxoacyl-ACP reductase-like protein
MTTERTEKAAAEAEAAAAAAAEAAEAEAWAWAAEAEGAAWGQFDPCLLLERLIIVGEKE